MRFLGLYLFALLTPVLSLIATVEAFAHGAAGVATLGMTLLGYGLVTEIMVRNRTERALLATANAPVRRKRQSRGASGKITFALNGSFTWSWNEERDEGDDVLVDGRSGGGDGLMDALPRVNGKVKFYLRSEVVPQSDHTAQLEHRPHLLKEQEGDG